MKIEIYGYLDTHALLYKPQAEGNYGTKNIHKYKIDRFSSTLLYYNSKNLTIVRLACLQHIMILMFAASDLMVLCIIKWHSSILKVASLCVDRVNCKAYVT